MQVSRPVMTLEGRHQHRLPQKLLILKTEMTLLSLSGSWVVNEVTRQVAPAAFEGRAWVWNSGQVRFLSRRLVRLQPLLTLSCADGALNTADSTSGGQSGMEGGRITPPPRLCPRPCDGGGGPPGGAPVLLPLEAAAEPWWALLF